MAEKILVVDDEPLICDLLTEILKKEKYEVEVSGDGEEALKKVKSDGRYACVLTDVKMPQMDGLQFLKESHKVSPSTPVIVVTGAATVDIAVEALKHGAAALIEKPFNSDKVLNTLREILSLRSVTDRMLTVLPFAEKKWTIECPGSQENLASILETLMMGMDHMGLLSPTNENPVRDALKHALDNAFVHGNEKDPKKWVRVNALATNEEIRVSIYDEGKGFNRLDYIEEDNLNEEAWKNGKGLFKIHGVAHTVSFNAKGNEIQLTFKKP